MLRALRATKLLPFQPKRNTFNNFLRTGLPRHYSTTETDKDTHQAIKCLSKNYSIEVTPAGAGKVDDFGNVPGLQKGIDINVTYLVGSDINDTFEICKKLVDGGMNPVAHCPARAFNDEKDLESYIDRLKNDIGVKELLCIGGGADKPVGKLHETMQVFKSGLLQKYGFEKVNCAVHPEGHPDVKSEIMDAAMLEKAEWANAEGIHLNYCTQFCFEPQPVIEWENNARNLLKQRLGEGKKMPTVTIGVAGPAKISALIKFAQMSGVGPSMRFVTKYAGNVMKLATKSDPNELVAGLANYKKNNDEFLVNRLHYYTFGGLQGTLKWANCASQGDFSVAGDEKSFTVSG